MTRRTPPADPSNGETTIRRVLRRELVAFVDDVAPHIRRELARLVKSIATTIRKTVHVLILVGLGLVVTWAFDLPGENRIEQAFLIAGAIIVGVAFIRDLYETHFKSD